ncbi:MAG TPA: hypothetical protein DDY98_02200 [Ruminococcaceae bacterium]|nr:hypothetical protein [Oscillospiraceae bacterium]
MGLFDKKFCDICGEKISLLGNRKLEDGNMCSGCAKHISPLMTDRRKTSVAEMKEHLAYRENNKQILAGFSASETYGEGRKVYIDRAHGTFVVSNNAPGSWEKENPDVIPIAEVSNCNLEIREDRHEEYYNDPQGNRKSFNPPRYSYEYDFYVHINLSSKWFNEIDLKLNTFDVDGLNSQRYNTYQMMGNQIVAALTGNAMNAPQGVGFGMGGMYNQNGYVQQQGYQQMPQNGYVQQQGYQQAPQQQAAPQAGPWVCPNCGSQNSGKFCEGCGTQKP